MKEKFSPLGDLPTLPIGIETIDHGALVETNYYFSGWIPIEYFTNGYRPEYINGWTGRETLVRTEGIKPATKLTVLENQQNK